jgi:DNA-binding response OmpR family regulator
VANGDRKRLLVVDDEKPIRQLLARIAMRAGFEVDTANDGVQALEMLQAKPYAIAIVDLMMPRLSGYELLQKIASLDPRPVVLVATAMANGDVASLDDSMVRRVIKKPFDVNAVAKALVETARQIAEQQQLADEAVQVAPPESVKIAVANSEPEEIAAAAAPPVESVPVEEKEEPPPSITEPPPEKH